MCGCLSRGPHWGPSPFISQARAQSTELCQLGFAHFLIGLSVFLVWSCVSSLYILEIKPSSELSLANIFSHTVGSLFILLMFSLAMQKL